MILGLAKQGFSFPSQLEIALEFLAVQIRLLEQFECGAADGIGLIKQLFILLHRQAATRKELGIGVLRMHGCGPVC